MESSCLPEPPETSCKLKKKCSSVGCQTDTRSSENSREDQELPKTFWFKSPLEILDNNQSFLEAIDPTSSDGNSDDGDLNVTEVNPDLASGANHSKNSSCTPAGVKPSVVAEYFYDKQNATQQPRVKTATVEKKKATHSNGQQASTSQTKNDGPSWIDENCILRLRIPHFSSLEETTCSDSKIIEGVSWRIMVMPKQHMVQKKSQKCMGFFLQCTPQKAYSDLWSVHAVADMRMLSYKSSVPHFARRTTHTYTAKENDWGYSCFMTWADVIDENQGYIRDDTVILEIAVKADPAKNMMTLEQFVQKIDRWMELADMQLKKGNIDLAIEANSNAMKFCKDKDEECCAKLKDQQQRFVQAKLFESIERIEKGKLPTVNQETPAKPTSLRQALTGAQKTLNGKMTAKGGKKTRAIVTVQQKKKKPSESSLSNSALKESLANRERKTKEKSQSKGGDDKCKDAESGEAHNCEEVFSADEDYADLSTTVNADSSTKTSDANSLEDEECADTKVSLSGTHSEVEDNDYDEVDYAEQALDAEANGASYSDTFLNVKNEHMEYIEEQLEALGTRCFDDFASESSCEASRRSSVDAKLPTQAYNEEGVLVLDRYVQTDSIPPVQDLGVVNDASLAAVLKNVISEKRVRRPAESNRASGSSTNTANEDGYREMILASYKSGSSKPNMFSHVQEPEEIEYFNKESGDLTAPPPFFAPPTNEFPKAPVPEVPVVVPPQPQPQLTKTRIFAKPKLRMMRPDDSKEIVKYDKGKVVMRLPDDLLCEIFSGPSGLPPQVLEATFTDFIKRYFDHEEILENWPRDNPLVTRLNEEDRIAVTTEFEVRLAQRIGLLYQEHYHICTAVMVCFKQARSITDVSVAFMSTVEALVKKVETATRFIAITPSAEAENKKTPAKNCEASVTTSNQVSSSKKEARPTVQAKRTVTANQSSPTANSSKMSSNALGQMIMNKEEYLEMSKKRFMEFKDTSTATCQFPKLTDVRSVAALELVDNLSKTSSNLESLVLRIHQATTRAMKVISEKLGPTGIIKVVAEVQAKTKQLDTLNDEVKQSQQQLISLRSKNEKTQKDLAEYSKQISSECEKNSKLIKEQKDLRTQLKKAENRATKEENRANSLQIQFNELDDKFKNLRKDLDQLKKKSAEERAKAKKDKERDTMMMRQQTVEISEKETERDQLKKENEEQVRQRDRIEKERRQLATQLASATDRAKAAEVLLMEVNCEKALAVISLRKTEATTALAETEENAKKARSLADQEALNKSLEEWRKAVEKIDSAIQATKQDYDAAIEAIKTGTKTLVQIGEMKSATLEPLPKLVRPPPVQVVAPSSSLMATAAALSSISISQPPAGVGVIGQQRNRFSNSSNDRLDISSPNVSKNSTPTRSRVPRVPSPQTPAKNNSPLSRVNEPSSSLWSWNQFGDVLRNESEFTTNMNAFQKSIWAANSSGVNGLGVGGDFVRGPLSAPSNNQSHNPRSYGEMWTGPPVTANSNTQSHSQASHVHHHDNMSYNPRPTSQMNGGSGDGPSEIPPPMGNFGPVGATWRPTPPNIHSHSNAQQNYSRSYFE
ncbi:unnamed protein product [Caenorhabditis auriculariae]|uniref:MATH domain-containing protein n=1 Tax=Caenorhabditis auriculariae TaxID=2777116 RepID=A0A8S1HNT1_9PELO|nr:unnamed protein product [Caenorhabditis auriculariae]